MPPNDLPDSVYVPKRDVYFTIKPERWIPEDVTITDGDFGILRQVKSLKILLSEIDGKPVQKIYNPIRSREIATLTPLLDMVIREGKRLRMVIRGKGKFTNVEVEVVD